MPRAFTIACLFLLSSCAFKFYPLKGHYPDTPIVYTTDKSFDHVWDKLVDLFAQKGISIRIIDKSSGFVSSGESLMSTTFEDKNGNPYDRSAFVVLARSNYDKDDNLKKTRYEFTGEWNVHITRDGEKIKVNVNIVNTNYYAKTYSSYKGESKMNIPFRAHTTGLFEKLIFEAIN